MTRRVEHEFAPLDVGRSLKIEVGGVDVEQHTNPVPPSRISHFSHQGFVEGIHAVKRNLVQLLDFNGICHSTYYQSWDVDVISVIITQMLVENLAGSLVTWQWEQDTKDPVGETFGEFEEPEENFREQV